MRPSSGDTGRPPPEPSDSLAGSISSAPGAPTAPPEATRPPPDPDLAAAWREWWLNDSVPDSPTPVDHANAELASLLVWLASRGFAIVRRLAADPPPPDPPPVPVDPIEDALTATGGICADPLAAPPLG